MERIIKTNDAVYSFNEIMAHIDLYKYFASKERRTGCREYDREKLLKVVLFAFMERGYCGVREIKKLCETDIRFLWLLDETKAPSHMTIQNFIHNELQYTIEDIFTQINKIIFEELSVDMNHIYIDGTKQEANAQKYTWVWKKSCIRSRNNVYTKLTEVLKDINSRILHQFRTESELRQEYSVEYVTYIEHTFLEITGLKEEQFVHGSGKRKTIEPSPVK